MSEMRSLEFEIQYQIIMAYKKAAELGDLNFFKSRGLGTDTIKYLKELPPNALPQIAKLSPFKYECSEALFNSRLISGINKDKEEKLVHRAIKLGASRKCLQTFTSINSKQYQRLRGEYVESANREKPPRISDEMLAEISKTHSNIKKQENKVGEFYSALEILIKLSESHNLEVNQLYTYYYCGNADLFDVERSLNSYENK